MLAQIADLRLCALMSLRSNVHVPLCRVSVYTCLFKIIPAAFLIAPAHLIQRFLVLSYSSFLRFFSYKTPTNAQLVLPVQTGLYRYRRNDE